MLLLGLLLGMCVLLIRWIVCALTAESGDKVFVCGALLFGATFTRSSCFSFANKFSAHSVDGITVVVPDGVDRDG